MTEITESYQVKRLPLFEFIALMAMLTSLVALSIDAMLPALTLIGDELNSISAQQTFLVVSIFFIGMSIGQLFFGPFADSYGRRLTILIGLVVFLLGTLVCYFAKSIEVLLVGRVIQAVGASGPRIASMAMIRDLYVGESMARVMSFITFVFILVPMIAPLIGQVVMNWYGWRQIFFVFAIVAVISGIWLFSRQAETLPRQYRRKFNFSFYCRSLVWLFKHPVVMGASIGMGCIFGAFLAYLSSSQTIFVTIYQTGDYFPLIFAILAFAIGAASLFNGIMVMRLGIDKLLNIALWSSLVFAFALTCTTYLYEGLPPLLIFIGLLFIGFFFVGVLFGNLNSLAMEPVGHIAGVGASIIGSFTSLLAVPIGVFIASFMRDDVTPIGLGFVVFCLLALVSVRVAIKYRHT